jgi:hypothetical protein
MKSLIYIVFLLSHLSTYTPATGLKRNTGIIVILSIKARFVLDVVALETSPISAICVSLSPN